MRTPAMQLHRRQFVFGHPDAVERSAEPGWTTTAVGGPIDSPTVLSADPALPINALTDADGRGWTVLGTALPTSGQGDLADELRRTGSDGIDALSRTWAGRFVLIGGGSARSDAGGLMALAVRQDVGGPVVSSSLSLLARSAPRQPLIDRPAPVGARPLFLEYVPPPCTRMPAVDVLLPSQVLSLGDGGIVRRPLLPEGPTGTTSEITDAFGDRLLAAMRQLGGQGRSIWLALTAGHDSRLWLAAALATGVQVRTFTVEYPEMKRSDRELPPVLAAAAGVEHRLVRPGRRDRDVLAMYDAHTHGAVVERDRDFMARGQYDHITDDTVLLRSGCFEVGSQAHYPEWPDAGLDLIPPAPEEIAARLSARAGQEVLDALQRWRVWALAAPDEVDWRVRFYLECRLPGWLGAVEQGLDMLPGTSLQLANCGAIYAAALALPRPHREAQLHQEELVARWAPDVAAMPYNSPDPVHRKVIRRARMFASRLGRNS